MHTILTVVGARPQFIKAAAISRAIAKHHPDLIREVIVHNGQHYDPDMSAVFFEQLGLPREHYNLQVGSGSHAQQTAAMLTGIEEVLLKERPALLLLYGDTNSTIAGALAASKLGIPIAHVEGGVRSRHKAYPEEVNRLLTDHLSTLIFCPTGDGMRHLAAEGLIANDRPPFTADRPGVFHCGDIMYDNSLFFAEQAARSSGILQHAGVAGRRFALATIHRPHNVDDPAVLAGLLTAFMDIAEAHGLHIVLPLHPRTKARIDQDLDAELLQRIADHPSLHILPPASFLDMIQLEREAALILTDSGGVQKEGYYFERPVVILLDRTPWVELLASGSAIETGADPERIKAAASTLLARTDLRYPPLFGDGHAAEFILDRIIALLEQR